MTAKMTTICLLLLMAGVQQALSTDFECDEGDTMISGFPKYSSEMDCSEVLTSLVDIYESSLVDQCNDFMDYDTPVPRVRSAYHDTCHTFDNGTIRYHTDICCEGALTKFRCYACDNETVQYDSLTKSRNTDYCNRQPLETCDEDEICLTQYNYYILPDGTTEIRVTKGCKPKNACYADAQTARDTTCMDGESPECQYCCSSALCNDRGVPSYIAYGPGGGPENDPCNEKTSQPSPCKNEGTCNATGLPDPTYICTCPPGYHGVNCEFSSCQNPFPCNAGKCRPIDTPPYYRCYCEIRYFGTHCTEEYTPCATEICQNGGECIQQELFQRCHCPDEYFGKYCEFKAGLQCRSDDLYFRMEDRTFVNYHNENSKQSCTSRSNTVARTWTMSAWLPKRCAAVLNTGFKTGTHGDLNKMYLEAVDLYYCEHGDEQLSYRVEMCCPSCLALPCQNEGWCIQTGNDYVCKCRYGYAGPECQYRTAMCVISGDPHYHTFDKKHIPFQGKCKYNLASLIPDSTDTPQFNISTRNEERHGNTDVAYTKSITVEVYGHTITLGRGNVVTVDGDILDPNFEILSLAGGKLTIQRNGRFIQVVTDFGLSVENDGVWVAVVKLPANLAEKVDGLCGNNNLDPDDDLTTSTGEDVSHYNDSFSRVGNSFKLPDPENPECPSDNNPNPEPCTEETFPDLNDDEYCGLITTDVGSPFAACINANPEFISLYKESCDFDVCENKDVEENAKDAACNTLGALAVACADKGYIVDWREAANCPLDCPEGKVYVFLGPACPSTCTNPLAGEQCTQPDTESCACPGRQVLREGVCVEPEECGCPWQEFMPDHLQRDDQPTFIEVGTTWKEEDCSKVYTCEYCEDCAEGYGVIAEEVHTCPVHIPVCENGECKVPCDGPIFCLSCHNTDDDACWITGRYSKCNAESTCYVERGERPSGIPIIRRGCKPIADCPETNSQELACAVGVPNPPAPERDIYLCHRPDYGTCSCKGDPHCVTTDGHRIPDLRSGCILTFARDSCVDFLPSGSPSFEVLINPRFEDDDINARVTISDVQIVYGSQTLLMARDLAMVEIDGTPHDITSAVESNPFITGGFNIVMYDGSMVRVTLPNGVETEWNFEKEVSVHTPNALQGQMCGICGDFDRDNKSGDYTAGPGSDGGSGTCPNLSPFLTNSGVVEGQFVVDDTGYEGEAFGMSWFSSVDIDDVHCVNRCTGE